MCKTKVYGVGINDYDGSTRVNGIQLKSYKSWKRMLERCYSDNFKNKNHCYDNVTVCDEWLYFSNFKKWFDENYRYDLVEQGIKIALDKDLMSNKDNKIYSPNTCLFIPVKINAFIANKNKSRLTKYPCIYKDKNKWKVRVKDFNTGKPIYLGCFYKLEDALIISNHARELEVIKAKEYLKSLNYSNDIVNMICI